MIAGTASRAEVMSNSMVGPRLRLGSIALVMAAFAMLLTMFAPFASPASAWSAPRTVFIEETGQTLDQVFLDVWRENGKQASFGYPITPEITLENGHVVQYFQYARFEYWPEGDANGQHFHFGDIGEELRPINVQRSTLSWSSTSSSSASSAEALAISQAWLPVSEKDAARGSRFVAQSGHTVSGDFRAFWEETGEEGYLGFPITETYTSGDTTYQVFERGQLAVNETDGVHLVPVGSLLAQKYGLDQSRAAQGDLPSYSEELFIPPAPPPVAGTTGAYVPGAGEVWIDINLSTQYMQVYQGNTIIMQTYISSGRPGFDTPTGTFHISLKNGTQDMEGVLGGEYYNVSNVPSVMYFTTVGHAIHGAYWHNNFGSVMSHGCINVPVDLAAWLYEVTPLGARVEIHW